MGTELLHVMNEASSVIATAHQALTNVDELTPSGDGDGRPEATKEYDATEVETAAASAAAAAPLLAAGGSTSDVAVE